MCLEAGCGACLVSIKRKNPFSLKFEIGSANSCLTLLFSCNGYEITTIEGLGDKKLGYHPIQKKLAFTNGSQCGYCSPAMVINMYSLLSANDGHVSVKQWKYMSMYRIQTNINAMKSFAVDAIDIEDIEDLSPKCPKNSEICKFKCRNIDGENAWYWPRTIEEIFDIFDHIIDPYMLVGGNTAHGAYRRPENIQTFININNIRELQQYHIGNSLTLGGNITLTNAIKIFRSVQNIAGFEYFEKVADHFELIANVPVRNMGTLAGNVMLKRQHLDFPSDVFLLFETIGAKINVLFDKAVQNSYSLKDFLYIHADKFVIKNFSLPKLQNLKFNSYKITVRSQNAHAHVNGAFLFDIDSTVINSATICFGGINPHFVHAKETESFLKQKDISYEHILQLTFLKLLSELDADWFLPDANPTYRRYVACGIFYKYIYLFCLQIKLILDFAVASENSMKIVLFQPVIKREALVQCSGEAFYNNDLPPLPNEVYLAFVQAKVVGAKIEIIDPTEALLQPKVVAFFSAKDIPGVNSFTVPGYITLTEFEQIFVSGTVLYYDQPLGVIAAETMSAAVKAAKKVKVVYSRYSVVPKALEGFKEENYLFTCKFLKVQQNRSVSLLELDKTDWGRGRKQKDPR
uniref:FAD-binding PCMH-type domain-containing protein n=1 Tax=Megaselia scalaris TaxID=36166 RepID=T1GSG5_MEGSC